MLVARAVQVIMHAMHGTVQEILEHDGSNYNALVFEGFAREGLQQPALALTVYNKASSLEPSLPLAWQASAACCFYLNCNYHYLAWSNGVLEDRIFNCYLCQAF